MMAAKSLIYQFLDVRVEVASFRVMRGGQALSLEPKAIETLIFLLERRGRLVEKDELLNGVWQGSFVTPNALTRIRTSSAVGVGMPISRTFSCSVPPYASRTIARIVVVRLFVK